MTVFQGFFLGLLQGVAEFLPISSSGHIAVVQQLCGLSETPLLFSVLLHVATLCAVCLFFRKRIWNLLCVLGRFCVRQNTKNDKPELTQIAALLCGTAATAVLGLAVRKFTPELPIRFVCFGFVVTGLLLIFSAFLPHRGGTISPFKGFFVGCAQGIGVLPGISRSGITISAALFAGIDRKAAGEFSFLLSIPAVLGALILEINDLSELMSQVPAAPVAVGCVTAFISGIFSLTFLMKLVQNGKLAWFACYLIPAGIAGLFFL